MTARTYEFVQVDIFTHTPFTGNPLAVFTDARGLTDKEIRAVVREKNLSETTSSPLLERFLLGGMFLSHTINQEHDNRAVA